MTSAFLIFLLLSTQSPVRGEERPPDKKEEKKEKKEKKGLPAPFVDCYRVEDFGGTDLERSAYCYAGEDKNASARKLADLVLRKNQRSARGHYVMGLIQHKGEGNLPKALFHLERAEELFEDRHGRHPSQEESPWYVYHQTLLELIYVHGEMDHHAEKVRYVDAMMERLGKDYATLKAWPLLKLKRFEEARLIAKQGIAREESSWHRAVGLTALCAVESEQRLRMPAYEACVAATKPIMHNESDGSIELSNAGAAAEEVFRFDEAERYYTLATQRPPRGSVNPWGRLARLYLRQGRFAEAVSSWREMRAYRERRPATFLDQQDKSEAELIGAAILLIAGKTKEAHPIAERTVNNPDRQGTSSAASDQNEAGAALIARVIKLDFAHRLEEQASFSPWADALELRARALVLRAEAWVVTRQAAAVLADRERLVSSLRPECPGSIEAPAWLDAETIEIVGPSIALAAIAEARREETLEKSLSDPIFLGLEAEAQMRSGRYEEALQNAERVVKELPRSEALLRARAAAIGAHSAIRANEPQKALMLYRLVLGTDPGVIRRLGHALPVSIEVTNDDAVKRAKEMLEDSPLFDAQPWGFLLRVSDESAVLSEQDGSEILSIRVPAGRKEDAEASARRIVRAVHKDLLVPNVDVTQADIRSLDGSLGTGGRASERVNSILEEVLKTPEH